MREFQLKGGKQIPGLLLRDRVLFRRGSRTSRYWKASPYRWLASTCSPSSILLNNLFWVLISNKTLDKNKTFQNSISFLKKGRILISFQMSRDSQSSA